MPDVEKSPILSIESGEVVPRGRPVLVRGRRKLADRSPSGVAVLGQTPSVTSSEDGRSVVVDTSELPPGPHRLMVSELAESRSGNRLAPVTVDFVVAGTDAPLPEDVVVRHAVRLRVDDLDVTRLPMDAPRAGPYVDAFKAVSRKGRRPVQLAFDELGNTVDLDEVLAGLAKRRLDRFGKLHPALHEAVARGGDVEVAVWLDVPDDVRVEKSERGQTKRRPAAEAKAREGVAARRQGVRRRRPRARHGGDRRRRLRAGGDRPDGRQAGTPPGRRRPGRRAVPARARGRRGPRQLDRDRQRRRRPYRRVHRRAASTSRSTSTAPTTPRTWRSPRASTPARRPATTPGTPTGSSRTSSPTRRTGTRPTATCTRRTARTWPRSAGPPRTTAAR